MNKSPETNDQANPRYLQLFSFLREQLKLKQDAQRDLTKIGGTDFFTYSTVSSFLDNNDWLDDGLAAETLLTFTTPDSKPPPEPLPGPRLTEWLKKDYQKRIGADAWRNKVEAEQKIKRIEEYPQVETTLAAFMQTYEQWRSAINPYRFAKRVSAVLDTSAADKTELVLAFGWLKGKLGGKKLNRPVCYIPLTVEAAGTDAFSINLPADTASLTLEHALLHGTPELGAAYSVQLFDRERTLNPRGNWAESVMRLMDKDLRQLCSDMVVNVAYEMSLTPPDGKELTMGFSPCLVFRKRTMTNYRPFYDQIISQLRNLPKTSIPTLNLILGLPAVPNAITPPPLPHFRFPRAVNAEQLAIAKATVNKAVTIVEGPPGTGKSHTIGNLAAHLLAQGKKVLITSQNEQALASLKQHVDDQINKLIVYRLAKKGSTDQALSDSITDIQSLIQAYQAGGLNAKAARSSLALSRTENARQGIVQDITEPAFSGHLNSIYSSTSPTVTITKLLNDQERFKWFQDEIPDLEAISKDQVGKLSDWHQMLQYLEAENYDSSFQLQVDLTKLPDPPIFSNCLQLNREIKALREDTPVVEARLQESFEILPQLKEAVQSVITWRNLHKNIAAHLPPETTWATLRSRVTSILSELNEENAITHLRDHQIEVGELSYERIITDVGKLIGKAPDITEKDSWTSLAQDQLRSVATSWLNDTRQLYKAKVNGKAVSSSKDLATLRQFAKIMLLVDQLEQLRPSLSDQLGHSPLATITHFQEVADLLELLPGPAREYSTAKELLIKHWKFTSPTHLQETPIESLLQTIACREIEPQYREQLTIINRAKQHLNEIFTTDELTQQVKTALLSHNLTDYELVYEAIKRQHNLILSFENQEKRKKDLVQYFPATVSWLEKNGPLNGGLRPAEIDVALHYANARYEIDRFCEKDKAIALNGILEGENSHNKKIAEHLLNTATLIFLDAAPSVEQLSSDLTAWEDAILRSSGKGKKVPKNKARAKKLFTTISQQIPCWVMTLDSLVTTLDPKHNLFDVIIVDEASRLKTEGLLLNYLGKQLILVGDERQTIQTSIQSQDALIELAKKEMPDVPYQETFDSDHSYLYHAKRTGAASIQLKDHFRCAPEIIAFSNKYSYQRADGRKTLVPLKQRKPGRLDPLNHHFVATGDFDSETTTNLNEAVAIVNKLVELVSNLAYTGKSFGVISLQGKNQAKLIGELAQKEPDLDLDTMRFRSATAAEFQGDERDVIFLSMVVSDSYTRMAKQTKKEARQRYNVAMSRAKEQVWLFHSADHALPSGGFREKLLNHIRNYQAVEERTQILVPALTPEQPAPPPFRNKTQIMVYEWLLNQGHRVTPGWQLGEDTFDLTVHLSNGTKFVITIEDEEGRTAVTNRIKREIVLARSGWAFYHLDPVCFGYSPDAVFRVISNRLQALNQ